MYCIYNIITIYFPLSRLILFCVYCFVNDKFSAGYPGILFGGGGSTNSVEDRGRGSGGGSPLVTGSGGSCNLVQGFAFYIVTFS